MKRVRILHHYVSALQQDRQIHHRRFHYGEQRASSLTVQNRNRSKECERKSNRILYYLVEYGQIDTVSYNDYISH